MNVRLFTHTPNIEDVVYTAARTCYSSGTPSKIWDSTFTPEQRDSLIRKVMQSGHYSVLEHVTCSFEIAGISRAASHQLVRHRLASFSQQSQRYVEAEEGVSFVVPESIAENDELHEKYMQSMDQIFKWYREFIDAGIKPEDARFVLPAGVCTNLVVTMNARELLHFFTLRCCRRAQWEIRGVAWRMLKQAQRIAPVIFEHAGPSCISDEAGCREGNLSCGKPYTPREIQSVFESFQ